MSQTSSSLKPQVENDFLILVYNWATVSVITLCHKDTNAHHCHILTITTSF